MWERGKQETRRLGTGEREEGDNKELRRGGGGKESCALLELFRCHWLRARCLILPELLCLGLGIIRLVRVWCGVGTAGHSVSQHLGTTSHSPAHPARNVAF